MSRWTARSPSASSVIVSTSARSSKPGTSKTKVRTIVGKGDLEAVHEIVEKVADAELFLYPGDRHYFADSSLPSYDGDATALLTRRVLEFWTASERSR